MNKFNIIAKLNPNMILKNIPVAVLVTDSDGRILWVNGYAASLFETSKRTMCEHILNDLVVDGIESVRASVAKEVPVSTAAMSLAKQEFFVEITAIADGDKYYVMINDATAMTDFLSNAEKSSKLSKDKNHMIYRLSTELKSPIQAIQGFSKALLDGMGGELNEKQAKYASIISKNAAEYMYFLDKFIQFAETESPSMESNYQIFDVINTVQNIIRDNDDMFRAKNIKLNFDADEITKRAIYSEERLFKIIVQNILEAEAKLTDSGIIDIKLSYPDLVEVRKSGLEIKEGQSENSFIKISVVDTGIGYSESDLEDLFEPYAHINRANRKNLVRTFSLGSVQNAVNTLHGSLTINTEVMKGCAFNVIIPVEKE